MRYIQLTVQFLLSLIIFTNCTSTKTFKTVDREDDLPGIEREFRAVWVASVANIGPLIRYRRVSLFCLDGGLKKIRETDTFGLVSTSGSFKVKPALMKRSIRL